MPAGIRDSAVIMCCQGGLRNNLYSDVSKTRSFVLSSCILIISTINSKVGYGFLIEKLEHTFIVIFHGLSLVMISFSVPKIFPSPDCKYFFSVWWYCEVSGNRTTVTSRTESPSRHTTLCLREAHTPTPLFKTYRLAVTKGTRS